MQLQGAITSVAAHGDHYFVGTNKSNVYYVNAKTFKEELRQVLLGSLFLDRAQLNHTVRGWSHSSLKNRGGDILVRMSPHRIYRSVLKQLE